MEIPKTLFYEERNSFGITNPYIFVLIEDEIWICVKGSWRLADFEDFAYREAVQYFKEYSEMVGKNE